MAGPQAARRNARRPLRSGAAETVGYEGTIDEGGRIMAKRSLQERAAALEREVTELKAAARNGTHQKDWEGTVGMFSGDELRKRVDARILKAREDERRKARRRDSGKRASTSRLV